MVATGNAAHGEAAHGAAAHGEAAHGAAPDNDGVPARDLVAVAALLGRRPEGAFEVVVRRADGTPAVIRNEPVLPDGRPMPTRWWLVDPELRRRVGTLEAEGGVRSAEAEVGAEAMAEAHRRYEALRDAAMPEGHDGPRPSGGVGGTRRGGKCLHAHLAWWLVGGADPTGEWVAVRLAERGEVPHLLGTDGPVRWPGGTDTPSDETEAP